MGTRKAGHHFCLRIDAGDFFYGLLDASGNKDRESCLWRIRIFPPRAAPARKSRLRTPIFKKGFENPRNLREGSLSGQRQSGCGSSSRVERVRATRCCGLSARVCVVCVLFPYVQSELQKHHSQDSLILCYHQIDSRSI